MRKLFALFAVLLLAAIAWVPTSAQSQPFVYFVPPSACQTSVSAGATGTQGLTVTGASNTPVVQASTSNSSGAKTHTYACNIAPPATLSGTSTVWRVVDAVFLYGVQTTDLDTQVSTGSAGTLNSTILFNYITYPSPGATETPSSVTPVRADAGTLVLGPVVASMNVAQTTAGAFYSQKFQPAQPIVWNTDLKQLMLKVTLLCQSTSATVTNSPGLFVHVRTF